MLVGVMGKGVMAEVGKVMVVVGDVMDRAKEEAVGLKEKQMEVKVELEVEEQPALVEEGGMDEVEVVEDAAVNQTVPPGLQFVPSGDTANCQTSRMETLTLGNVPLALTAQIGPQPAPSGDTARRTGMVVGERSLEM